MSTAMPVIVAETFTLHPSQGKTWSDVGRAIRRAALGNRACLSFRLMRDHRNDSRAVLLSEWTSLNEFNRFVRESGVLWLERGVHPSLAGKWSLLEQEDDELPTSSASGGLGAKKPVRIADIEIPGRERDSRVRT